MLSQSGAPSGLGDEPERPAVIKGGQRVGDVPVSVQDECLDAAVTGHEAGEHLAGQGRQPAQPIGAGHDDDVAGQRGHGGPADQEPLLAQRVAVVGGDGLIRIADGVGNRARAVQERGLPHQARPSARGLAEPSAWSAAMAARRAAPGSSAGSSGPGTRPSRPEA